ncbi:MAG: hypothetical protein A4E73_00053 [Syntrophaceae bacterium PtaU1.Bin231]|nr:MAG: hypothetical protein A4E73_00053 [Syntrophaceae bacterium PtaU1.Bin231]
MSGCWAVVFDPVMKKRSASSNSPMEFVMAPDPNDAARPATVELCQRRAQWSTLFVLRAARASFMSR